MARKVKKTKQVKKQWVNLAAPGPAFNNASIGQTPYYNIESVAGKTLKVNLMTLNRDMKSQNINLSFKVIKCTNDQANTMCIGYEMIAAALKRLVRKGKDKLLDSFVIETKDKKLIRVKPLAITHNNTYKSVGTVLKKNIRALLIKAAQNTEYETLMADVIHRKLQRYVKDKVKKLYPLRAVEIVSMKLVTKGRPLKLVERKANEG